MTLITTSLWLLIYPIIMLKFVVATSLEIFLFVFHSPVDVWVSINNVLEEYYKEKT